MSTHPKKHRLPQVAPTKHSKGFALIIALTLMSFMVILSLSLATFLNVEMHMASHQNRIQEARQNAIFGALVALGQLQIHAGPDQRVTAPATISYPPKNPSEGELSIFDIFQNHASGLPDLSNNIPENWKTFLAQDWTEYGGTAPTSATTRDTWETELDDYWTGKHPYWMGIWDASVRDETTGDFVRTQTPRWLVSGNENITKGNLANQITPDTNLDELGVEYVELVGYHSAPTNDPGLITEDNGCVLSNDGLDGRVIAPVVDIRDSGSILVGKYAYWVSDESLKANMALRDPYYDIEDTDSVEYKSRLQVPQRAGWERVGQFAGIFDAMSDSERKALINSPLFPQMASPEQIPLIDKDFVDPLIENFHQITTTSSSIFTDTSRGGLQKDLYRYLNAGDGGDTISDADVIPNLMEDFPAGYEQDPRFGPTNEGFPHTTDNIPTWGQVREWYNNKASDEEGGAISVTDTVFPAVSQVRLFYGVATDDATGELRLLIWPQIVLWNPFDAGLKTASYTIKIKFNPRFQNFLVATKYPPLGETDPKVLPPDDPQVREYQIGATRHPFWFHTVDLNKITPSRKSNSSVGLSSNHVHGDPNDAIYGVLSDETTVFNKNMPATNFTILEENSELELTFTTDFMPGETLIFTAGGVAQDDFEISASSDGLSIPLVNDSVEDNPPAAYYVFGKINPSSFYTGTGIDPYLHVTWASGAWVNDQAGLDITYLANGIQLMDEPNYASAFGGPMTNSFNATRTTQHLKDQPLTWRQLWSMRDPQYFFSMPGDEDTLNRELLRIENGWLRWEKGIVPNPLIGVGEAWIEPTYLRTWNDLTNISGFHDRFRAFANYNVMARHFMNFNPMVEATRANVDDGFDAIPMVRSVKEIASGTPITQSPWYGAGYSEERLGNFMNKDDAGAIRNKGLIWDAGFGDRFRVEGDRVRSFSLLKPYQYDAGLGTDSSVDPKLEALDVLAVRPVLRADTEVLSLGQLQQVNLSPFSWQPAFTIGNSEASAYVDREYMSGIHSRKLSHRAKLTPDRTALYNSDGVLQTFSSNQLMFAHNNRPNHMVDMSYLLNDAIWDRFFLSTIPQSGGLAMDGTDKIPNGRIRFRSDVEFDEDDVRNVDDAARYLTNFGGFNVNSTSVEAWKALITGFRNLKMNSVAGADSTLGKPVNPDETVPVTRTLAPKENTVDFVWGDVNPEPNSFGARTSGYHRYQNMLNGYRYLTDDMIQVLAERIVDEVRLRGPFYSMSDFVNRRLVAPDNTNNSWLDARTSGNNNNGPNSISKDYHSFVGLSGINGTLQRALNVSGINGGVNYPTMPGYNKDRDIAMYPHQASEAGQTPHYNWRWNTYPSTRSYVDAEHKTGSPVGEQGLLLSHTPGFITQGDLLTMLAPALRPRGDTFLIRTYGSSINKLTGETEAEAWLEMTVQRMPEPLVDGDGDYEPDASSGDNPDVGRKFEIIDVRWLTEDEV